MKLDSILIGTTIDQITPNQAINLATLLSWLANNEADLECSDYEIFTGDGEAWSLSLNPPMAALYVLRLPPAVVLFCLWSFVPFVPSIPTIQKSDSTISRQTQICDACYSEIDGEEYSYANS